MIVECFGITKFPDNGNYAMVLNYKDGNLRNHLQKNHSKLTLKDRFITLRYLCNSLYLIHEKDFIHCDLHSGNILIEGNSCYITDLGLCGPVDEESSNKIYGIVSYIAPEVLQGKKHTKESDIYSIGMIMWELFAGHPPFDDMAHDVDLMLKICKGLRPSILPNMLDDYAQIMQKCWDADPSKRPTIREIQGFADKKLKEIYEGKIDSNNNSNINSNDSNNSDSPQQAHKNHPLAYHTSRILDDEIAKLNLITY